MKPLILTLHLLFGADAATTHFALTHGAREVVLPTQNPWAIDGIVAGEDAITTVGLERLHRAHPKLALTVGWSLVAVRGAVVASNLRQLRHGA